MCVRMICCGKKARAKSRFLIAEAIRNDSLLGKNNGLAYMADVTPSQVRPDCPPLRPLLADRGAQVIIHAACTSVEERPFMAA